VEELPELRRALTDGKLSWSMGELLARVAQPEDEGRWLECAVSHTVRQMRGLVSQALSRVRAARGGEQHAAGRSECANDAGSEQHAAGRSECANGAGSDNDGSRSDARVIDIDSSNDGDPEEQCMLSCSVAQEDGWLFEATRVLLGQLGTHGADAQLAALLAEGQGTLLAALPEGALDHESWEAVASAQRRGARRARSPAYRGRGGL
jgi:hypothetical protein